MPCTERYDGHYCAARLGCRIITFAFAVLAAAGTVGLGGGAAGWGGRRGAAVAVHRQGG